METKQSLGERATQLKDIAYQLKSASEIVLEEAQRMEAVQTRFKQRAQSRYGYRAPARQR
jgi:hypothetical protein